MGKESSAPKAPSYSAYTKTGGRLVDAAISANKTNTKLASDQFDYFKKLAGRDAEIRDEAIHGLFDSADYNADFAKSLQDRYKSVFQPLEDDLIAEFKDYATPGRYDLNRGRAMSDVAQQYEAARRNSTRELESYGINPAATRLAALDLGVRTQEAAAKAAAANQADQQTDATRRALRTEAIGYGLKLPGMADTAYDTANAGRLGAAGLQLDSTKTAAATQGTAPQFGALGNDALQTGTAANKSTSDIVARGYDQSLDAAKFDSEQSSGWGDALGLVAGLGAKAFLGPTMPWAFAAEGGAIPAPGAVPNAASPSGGQKVDDVNAKLTAGEFVLPEDVTRWIGEKKLQDMILKARDEKKGAGAKPKQGQAIPGPVTYTSRPGVGAIPNR